MTPTDLTHLTPADRETLLRLALWWHHRVRFSPLPAGGPLRLVRSGDLLLGAPAALRVGSGAAALRPALEELRLAQEDSGAHLACCWTDEAVAPEEAWALERDLSPTDRAGGVLQVWSWPRLAAAVVENPVLARLAAGLGEGDVLARYLSRAGLPAEEYGLLFTRHLAVGLLTDQYARLESSGLERDRRILLQRVFIDLLAPTGSTTAETEEQQLGPGFLAELLQDAVWPSVAGPGGPPPSTLEGPDDPGGPLRRLLIGGPGQGKSTLGQYACQLHRAVLLRSRLADLDPEAEATVAGILRQAEEAGGGGRPVVARFPLRVPLARFAGELAHGRVTSIRSWWAAQLAEELGGPRPDEAGLLAWLTAVPSLLILDGLDEVPGSANRAEVLAALYTFLQELTQTGADQVVVATTRPQGYQGELDPQRFRPRRLQPLSPRRARTYAGRLLLERHRTDPIRRQELQRRFEASLEQPQTARLAQSPLQVTILCTLVEQAGPLPRERWRLFSEYYRRMTERERAKPGPIGAILQNQPELIQRLHWEVGFRLHLAGESAGSGEASLTEEQFSALVEAELLRLGYDPHECQELRQRIREAIFERLVFLVTPREGRVGFEVRSLQEYAASERLMMGDEGQIRRRLRLLAPSTHWRSVLLFVAGQIAATRVHLLEELVLLCRELDADPAPAVQLTRPGARLALALLTEGPAAVGPRVQRELLDQAVLLLRTGDAGAGMALVQGCPERLQGDLLQQLEEEVRGGPPEECFAAWRGLLEGVIADVPGAQAVAQRHWPSAPGSQLALLRPFAPNGRELGRSVWLLTRLAELWWQLPPQVALNRFSRFTYGLGKEQVLMEVIESWLEAQAAVLTPAQRSALTALLRRDWIWWNTESSNLVLECDPVRVCHWHLAAPLPPGTWQVPADAHPDWTAFQAQELFAANPSAAGLAVALRALAGRPSGEALRFAARRADWPLAACLEAAPTLLAQEQLAQAAEVGELGDLVDWQRAEGRWARSGITEEDLRHVATGPWPFDGTLADRGAPPAGGLGYNLMTSPEPLVPLLQRLPAGRNRRVVARLFTELARLHMNMVQSADPNGLAEWLAAEAEELDSQALLFRMAAAARFEAPWPLLLDRVGQQGRIREAFFNVGSAEQALFSTCLANHPELPGLWTFGAALCRGPGGLTLPWPPPAPATLPTPRLRSEAWLCYSIVGSMTADQTLRLATQLLDSLTELPDFELDLYSALRLRRRPPVSVALLVELARRLPPRFFVLRSLLTSLLVTAQATALSALQQPGQAATLGLPGPPEEQVHQTVGDSGPTPPVSLVRLALRDVCGLRELELTRPPAAGQWTFLIGDNGSGKTSLLRALVLGLVPREVAAILLANLAAPPVRIGAAAARIEVTLAPAGQRNVDLRRRNGSPPTLDYSGSVADFFLVAYGSSRGSALGGPDREVKLDRPEQAVLSLFADSARLIHAETWLKDWDALAWKAEAGAPARAFWDSIRALLCRLLPGVTELEVDRENAVWIQGPRLGRVPLAALSDGYLTTAGWVLDLVARWVHWQRGRGRQWVPTAEFPQQMTGLVVVDEIDLHLHPAWQREVVHQLRTLFPALAFVVTTHNPLPLLDARPGELHVLQQAEEGCRLLQLDLPPGVPADRVLTGEWFGLPTSRDRATLELLEQHRQLLRTRPDAPEVARLEEQLRQRLSSFADNSVERLAAQAAAEVIEQEYATLTPAERAAARDKVRRLVAARRASR